MSVRASCYMETYRGTRGWKFSRRMSSGTVTEVRSVAECRYCLCAKTVALAVKWCLCPRTYDRRAVCATRVPFLYKSRCHLATLGPVKQIFLYNVRVINNSQMIKGYHEARTLDHSSRRWRGRRSERRVFIVYLQSRVPGDDYYHHVLYIVR